MQNASKGLIVGGMLLGLAIFGLAIPLLVYSSREVSLKTSIEAAQLDNTVIYDRVWKTISQQAQISDKYQESFKQIYADIMNNRYKEGSGKLAQFIKESNPQFDSKLFDKLMSSIESNRRDFERAQTTLIDKNRERNNLLEQPISGFYLVTILKKQPMKIQLVTSTKTQDSFNSGKDDDVQLFPPNK